MIIDGRALAKEVLARTKERAKKLQHRPKVSVFISPDETQVTHSYLKIKEKSALEAGCDFEITRNSNFFHDADAAIIQLPLPPKLKNMLDLIPIEKDADVLSKAAREKFERGDKDALLPPVVGAVHKILEIGGIEIEGKNAVVIGRGFLVGAPVATWLKQQGAEVTIINRSSSAVARATLATADIIVSGAGSPHLIKPDMLKERVVLIDAGTSESNGELVGDADPACAEICSIFTPVPGGIGPLAVACLFENVVTLAEQKNSSILSL
ncbi:MAG: bifunctional 5,10-methylenetetrahydrofolate dehydrogenase/5,10-methenyltetrahydrofolate cyclohydrolase [bacterium]